MPIIFNIEDDINDGYVILNNFRNYYRRKYNRFITEDYRRACERQNLDAHIFLVLGNFIRRISGGLLNLCT